MHLLARNDGAGRIANAEAAVSKAVAAKAGRNGRTGANCAAEKTEGLMRRLRNVTGMVGGGGLRLLAVDKSSRCDIAAD